MAVALETVVKQLEDSGIVAPGKLENFVPPKAHPTSVEELIAQLVKENHLTKFQAAQVAAGKAKSLILGAYTILDRIGAGGMGQVFKALHRRMDRLVAIKMLPTAMTKDAAAAARFEREVRAAAKLNHPNIVTAYDADQANGVHFLVMECVEGSDLSALVKKNGPFPIAKAVNYVLQAARGLEFAHKKGVIHRDIKPANLLLDSEGTVKILDMGLARIESEGNVAAQAELTGTGAIMGTVDYMAPEQGVSTKHADARADIYSLGCTLHYLFIGKATYGGETVMAKMLAHHHQPIPNLRQLNGEVPEQVQAVFNKMVAKTVEDRYQTMTEVIAALERLGGNSGTVSDPYAATAALSSGALPALKGIDVSRITARSAATKQVATAKPSGKQPPWKKVRVLVGAGAAGLALLFGVILIVRDKDNKEVARIDAADGTKVTLPAGGSVQVQQGSSKAIATTGSTVSVGSAPAPSTALTFGGHRYLLVVDPVTWNEARTKATALGGHLATITTKEENEWINSTALASLPTEMMAWIGGVKESNESNVSFTWVTGEPWAFTDWGQNGTTQSGRTGVGIINGSQEKMVWGSWLTNVKAIASSGSLMGKNRAYGYLVEWDAPTSVISGPVPPLAKAPFDAAQAKAHQEAWAKHLGTEVETTNSVGMKMVLIPPGEFLMGSTDEQVEAVFVMKESVKENVVQATKDRIRTEQPQHRVVITKPFFMGKTEVTIGQFRKFVDVTQYVTEAEQYGFGNSPLKVLDNNVTDTSKQKNWRIPYSYAVTDDSPVAQITWNDASAYSRWLSTEEKTTYRLPTEAEWEYACRAGTTTQYSFGDDVDLLDRFGWYDKNSGGKPHPVGTKPPNSFGLHDMHGHLYEWCRDFFDEKWYEKTSSDDPNGPQSGLYCVARSGYLANNASICRSAHRAQFQPSHRANIIGFRIVRELSAPSTTVSITPQPVPVAVPAKPITDFNSPDFQAWMKEVQAMTAEEQVKAVSKKLVELNPGFDGAVTPRFVRDAVREFRFIADDVSDISPVQALVGLQVLRCSGTNSEKCKLLDLTPLRGMSLTVLECDNTRVYDLSPLETCKSLILLAVQKTKVTPAAVAALQAKLPNCKIEWDDPAKATTPQPAPSGTK